MKRNELAEVKKLEVKVINERVKKTREEIAGLVVDKNLKKSGNKKGLTNKRKDLAQMLTILRQKEILTQLEGVEDAK